MLKISGVYLIGKAEIPINYTTWSQVEQALHMVVECPLTFFCSHQHLCLLAKSNSAILAVETLQASSSLPYSCHNILFTFRIS